jgi:hypothetical protein
MRKILFCVLVTLLVIMLAIITSVALPVNLDNQASENQLIGIAITGLTGVAILAAASRSSRLSNWIAKIATRFQGCRSLLNFDIAGNVIKRGYLYTTGVDFLRITFSGRNTPLFYPIY